MRKTTCKCDICKKKKDSEELIVLNVSLSIPDKFVKFGSSYSRPRISLDICLRCAEERGLIKKMAEEEAKAFQVSPADVLYGAIEEIVTEVVENQ